jgi:hypothetical protein
LRKWNVSIKKFTTITRASFFLFLGGGGIFCDTPSVVNVRLQALNRLEIPTGYSEDVALRVDNAMPKINTDNISNCSTKQYTETHRLNYRNHVKNRGWTHMLQTSQQCLFHMWQHATNLVTSHEWRKNRIVITTNGTYSRSFVTQIFQNG